ncbi:hypothetical protein LINGRAHAP2_LOCUS36079 [Linum grandiflorum]
MTMILTSDDDDFSESALRERRRRKSKSKRGNGVLSDASSIYGSSPSPGSAERRKKIATADVLISVDDASRPVDYDKWEFLRRYDDIFHGGEVAIPIFGQIRRVYCLNSKCISINKMRNPPDVLTVEAIHSTNLSKDGNGDFPSVEDVIVAPREFPFVVVDRSRGLLDAATL